MTLLLTYGNPFAVALAANIKVFPGLVADLLGRSSRVAPARDRSRPGWRHSSGSSSWSSRRRRSATSTSCGSTWSANVQNLSLYAISPLLWQVSVVVMAVVALILARTRWGWPAAIVLSVFATPRLLSYQLSTSAGRLPADRTAPDGASGASRTLTP